MSNRWIKEYLDRPITELFDRCNAGYYQTPWGAIYERDHNGWARRYSGTGAYHYSPVDVTHYIASGEWKQIVSPRLRRRAGK